MSEQAPPETQNDTEMTPVLAIGGLLSFKRQWPFYHPLLKDSDCDVPVKERFFAVPDGGHGAGLSRRQVQAGYIDLSLECQKMSK